MKFATPIRLLIVMSFFPFIAFSQQSQILYKLQLLPDGQTWGVYIKPDASLPPNQQFLVGSGQVTVVMPLNYPWAEFTTVSGQWSPNSIVHGPVENPTKSYVSFGLISTAVWPINIVPGQETLLFKFKQTSDCPESLALFDNITDVFNPPNSVGNNPGNDLYVWGSTSGPLNYGGNYALAAWDCHDNDNDGILNAHEDTNGNGAFDPGIDASNLNYTDLFAEEQVLDLKLQLMPDGQTWGVYVKPDDNVYPSQLTQVAAGQLTIVMPLDYQFSNLASVSGKWQSDARIDGPMENPTKSYISVGFVQEFPHIDFTNGQETLLFTFKGDGNCPDEIYLFNNASDPLLPPNSVNANAGNDLTVFDPVGLNGIYEYRGNYATHAWDCHDSDGDGLLNAHEDTNGNGVYDPTDASDINGPNQLGCIKLKLKKLAGTSEWAVVTKAFDDLVPTGDAQVPDGRVTIVAPSDFELMGLEGMAGNWTLTNTVVSPLNNPTRKYLIFELTGAASIPLSATNETTLFKFGWPGECLDSLYVMENNLPFGLQYNRIIGTVQTSQGMRGIDLCGVYAHRTWRCNRNSWGTPVPGTPLVGNPGGNLDEPAFEAAERGNETATQAAYFAASPNPAGDFVNIKLGENIAEGKNTIALWDLQGKKRLETTLENSTYLRLGLTDLPAGVYFITLSQNGKVVQREKLVKQ